MDAIFTRHGDHPNKEVRAVIVTPLWPQSVAVERGCVDRPFEVRLPDEFRRMMACLLKLLAHCRIDRFPAG